MNKKLKELQEKNECLYNDNQWALNRCINLNEEKEKIERSYNKLQKDYENLFTAKQETEKRLTETNKMFKELIEYKDKYFDLFIRKIVHNKEKGTTVVWFYKNDKIIVKRRKGAKDDVYTAVAYAIAEKLYGSNTRFKKAVEDVKM